MYTNDIEGWITDDGVGHWPGVVRAVDEIVGDKAKRIESIWFVEL